MPFKNLTNLPFKMSSKGHKIIPANNTHVNGLNVAGDQGLSSRIAHCTSFSGHNDCEMQPGGKGVQTLQPASPLGSLFSAKLTDENHYNYGDDECDLGEQLSQAFFEDDSLFTAVVIEDQPLDLASIMYKAFGRPDDPDLRHCEVVEHVPTTIYGTPEPIQIVPVLDNVIPPVLSVIMEVDESSNTSFSIYSDTSSANMTDFESDEYDFEDASGRDDLTIHGAPEPIHGVDEVFPSVLSVIMEVDEPSDTSVAAYSDMSSPSMTAFEIDEYDCEDASGPDEGMKMDVFAGFLVDSPLHALETELRGMFHFNDDDTNAPEIFEDANITCHVADEYIGVMPDAFSDDDVSSLKNHCVAAHKPEIVSNDVNHVPQIACIVYPEDIPVEPVITSELSLSLIGDDTEEVEFWTAVKVFETIWDEKVDVVERGWVQGYRKRRPSREDAESTLLESLDFPLPPNVFAFNEVDDRMDSPCPSYRSHPTTPIDTPRSDFSLMSGRKRTRTLDVDLEPGSPSSFAESPCSTPSSSVFDTNKFSGIKSWVPPRPSSSPSTARKFLKRLFRLGTLPH